ncbi:MAG: isoaspartyl peptidase/L-asparaginase, partial [Bacteroidota bacterium]
MRKTYSIAIHGGAGTIRRVDLPSEKEREYRKYLQLALETGQKILQSGGTALTACTEAVVILEDCPLFNAGRGSVFTHEGEHEMDAALMEGEHLKAGAISLVKGVRNPIRLAKSVLLHSHHVFLAGKGAEVFAREHELAFEAPSYFADAFRKTQWQEALKTDQIQLDHSASWPDNKFGTVGAVACDQKGNLAAATSTGGMTNKRYGRIGDSPLIGAGTYANNKTCAVSATGHGEYFIRGVVAYDIACLMEYQGLSVAEASNRVIHQKQPQLGGEGGVIAVDGAGNVGSSPILNQIIGG